jgi:hypothetical protein
MRVSENKTLNWKFGREEGAGGGGCKTEVEKEALPTVYSWQNTISMITWDENEMGTACRMQ